MAGGGVLFVELLRIFSVQSVLDFITLFSCVLNSSNLLSMIFIFSGNFLILISSVFNQLHHPSTLYLATYVPIYSIDIIFLRGFYVGTGCN